MPKTEIEELEERIRRDQARLAQLRKIERAGSSVTGVLYDAMLAESDRWWAFADIAALTPEESREATQGRISAMMRQRRLRRRGQRGKYRYQAVALLAKGD